MTTSKDIGLVLRELTRLTDAEIDQLAEVLVDCVEGGASVNFMMPFAKASAIAFWQRIAADAGRGARILLVAEDHGRIVGTVQLVLEQPENQQHRADVSKMLVHRGARRRGIGMALMRAIEDVARRHARTLLVLDTASEDAERVYARLGWVRVGSVPGYALWPDGAPCDATFYYRRLA